MQLAVPLQTSIGGLLSAPPPVTYSILPLSLFPSCLRHNFSLKHSAYFFELSDRIILIRSCCVYIALTWVLHYITYVMLLEIHWFIKNWSQFVTWYVVVCGRDLEINILNITRKHTRKLNIGRARTTDLLLWSQTRYPLHHRVLAMLFIKFQSINWLLLSSHCGQRTWK